MAHPSFGESRKIGYRHAHLLGIGTDKLQSCLSLPRRVLFAANKKTSHWKGFCAPLGWGRVLGGADKLYLAPPYEGLVSESRIMAAGFTHR